MVNPSNFIALTCLSSFDNKVFTVSAFFHGDLLDPLKIVSYYVNTYSHMEIHMSKKKQSIRQQEMEKLGRLLTINNTKDPT